MSKVFLLIQIKRAIFSFYAIITVSQDKIFNLEIIKSSSYLNVPNHNNKLYHEFAFA